MSMHNVRVRARLPHGLYKNLQKCKVDDRFKKAHMFTKTVMEKKALREIYIKLMYDAERAVGRKKLSTFSEMLKLFGKKLTVDMVFFGRSSKIDFNY